ncbi:MAG: single-stranded-DNA-specific exonuclease RecJ [Candidatus Aminicenantes bacterium]|nr:single-stranded-DNA-specific exonuclease RecJ [Candidatus Aminicenantes bacterium]
MELDPRLEELVYKMGLPPVVGRLLFNRGINTEAEARLFLYGDFEDLSSPFLFQDMEKAVDRIATAIKEGEKILIFGDYDVDGITSTALLVRGLESLGGRVSYIIPNRISHGYGAKPYHVNKIKKEKASLVITVDNGIKSTDFAASLKKEGIDLIITDHHLPGDELPQAYALIDPYTEDNFVPKNLAGVGVAFKLLHGLFLKKNSEPKVLPYLKMVALGTIADMVELLGENRIMVKKGLEFINEGNSHGLSKLMDVSGLRGKRITPKEVAYRISPRINAAGRIFDPEIALKLLLSRREKEAEELAGELNSLNYQRQKLEARILKEAESLVDDSKPLIFVYSENWHRGVLGIVAYRLSRKYRKPALVFSVEEDEAFGSGRSPEGMPLIDALSHAHHLLLSYGGHELAAGLVVKRENLESLRARLEEYFHGLSPEEKPERRLDGEFDFEDIKLFFGYHRLFPPYGIGNPQPRFMTKNVEVVNDPGPWSNGFKVLLKQGNNIIPGIFFKSEYLFKFRKGERVNIIYTLKEGDNHGIEINIEEELK